jgi:hypothetical protein
MDKYKIANCIMDCKESCKDKQHSILAVILFFVCPVALLFMWPNPTKIE